MINKKQTISIIACISKNRGIGKGGKLLFNIPEDLQNFKKITFGHPIIMGYNTYKSIGRPLPGRLNVVLSLDDIKIDNVKIAKSIDEAIKIASQNDKEEIFFIGGGIIYQQAIKLADRLYLTIVDKEKEADTFFPDYSEFNKIISEEKKESDGYKYKFVILERQK
ncbi:MAG: Dihydrofolate reductase [Berkelbacteria bacterium GW2011_GWA1_36_9]|uniref:Dihydrofolate reductase n=1 Tax=Berkelbacteria bacterium GW2011_GWA1_36_9 TaxID=1618331 RepID=A0A0G0FJ94_9BACT|nr:MAG: Dihydrofolate reductase [Berkelbacteria bacterium GW2011_GWA1_36_9]